MFNTVQEAIIYQENTHCSTAINHGISDKHQVQGKLEQTKSIVSNKSSRKPVLIFLINDNADYMAAIASPTTDELKQYVYQYHKLAFRGQLFKTLLVSLKSLSRPQLVK